MINPGLSAPRAKMCSLCAKHQLFSRLGSPPVKKHLVKFTTKEIFAEKYIHFPRACHMSGNVLSVRKTPGNHSCPHGGLSTSGGIEVWKLHIMPHMRNRCWGLGEAAIWTEICRRPGKELQECEVEWSRQWGRGKGRRWSITHRVDSERSKGQNAWHWEGRRH